MIFPVFIKYIENYLKLLVKNSILFTGVIASILLIMFYEGKNYPIQNVLVIILSVFLLLIMLLNYFKNEYSVIKELWFVHVIFALFFDFAFFSKYTIKTISYSTILFIIVLNICVIIYTFVLIKFYIIKAGKINQKTLSTCKFKFNATIFIIILFYLLLRIKFIDTAPVFDSSLYIEALLDGINNFDFSIKTFINNFSFFKHNSSGYAALISISQFFEPGNIYLLNIENTLINIIAIYSFNKIICYFFDYKKYFYEICFICCIFAFNPLFFGTSLSINIDFPYMVFFTACLSAYLYKEKILFVFYSTLLVLTKETGFLLYVVFVSFLLLFIFIKNKFCFLSLIKSLFRNIYLYISGFLFFFYYLQRNGQFWGHFEKRELTGNILSTLIKNQTNSFWLSSYSTYSLFSMLFINFTWIETFFILLFVFRKVFIDGITIIRKKNIMTTIIMTYFFYFLFNIFFKTFPHPRYVVATVFFNTFFFLFAIKGLIKDKIIKYFILIIILLLNILSIFKTFDPVTLALYPNFKYKNGYLAINVQGKKWDSHVYNAQFAYHTKLLNNIFKKIKIKYYDKIIFFDTDENEIGITNKHGFMFPSNKIDVNTFSLTRKRKYTYVPDTYFLNSKKPNYNLLSSIDEAYYISNPWEDNETDCKNILNEIFEITDIYEVIIDKYNLRAYKLKRK